MLPHVPPECHQLQHTDAVEVLGDMLWLEISSLPAACVLLLNSKLKTCLLLPYEFLPACGCARSPDAPTADAAEVETRYSRMPESLQAALLPFQQTGVRFGLERRGRVLIADEMGVGKTVQALALASCYQV